LDLRQNPTSFGYAKNVWDGKMLSHHLKEKYDIKLGVRQCQRLFNKLNFQLRKRRPVIAKSDDGEKAELEFRSYSGISVMHATL
jgi:transposase